MKPNHFLPFLFLFSCSLPQQNILFNSQQEVFLFVYENYHYEKIDGEPLQLPEVTLETLKGDCGDWAFFAVYYLNQINIDAKFAVCRQSDYPKNYYHALVYIDGVLYEPRGGIDVTDKYEISFLYSYELALLLRPILQ